MLDDKPGVFQIGIYDSVIYRFWNIAFKSQQKMKKLRWNDKPFFVFFEFVLASEEVEYSRSAYHVLNALGEFGGLQGVLTLIAAVFVTKFSQHSYIVEMISKLYLAKTTDVTLFEPPQDNKATKRSDKAMAYREKSTESVRSI